ncbi:glycosyltransferase family 2 protein [Leeuwenhoekiella sp. NPDC079379]|uniref:glycosyltransferase family 2 protein n=1 Tax=Leeuwenhoekiella sp. NPDC079379 TaxID=3364122 RepID=UPI0037CC50C0
MCELAIVLPVYKAVFLKEALNSLAKQTNKQFNVYIGDDCSPDSIETIVDEFREVLNITYFRFTSNLGSKSLVHQWERCIDLTKNEEWLWLFSDDDVIDAHCVDTFYKELSINRNSFDLFRFNVKVVDEANQTLYVEKLPQILSSFDFLKKKLRGNISAYVVEYIFRRSFFEEQKRFEEFDLAWNSDVATWLKLASKRGIKTISGPFVRWRSSTFNISPNHTDLVLINKKIQANLDFSRWLKTVFFKNNIIGFWKIYPYLTTWFITSLSLYTNVIEKKELLKFMRNFFSITSSSSLKPLGVLYLKFKKR